MRGILRVLWFPPQFPTPEFKDLMMRRTTTTAALAALCCALGLTSAFAEEAARTFPGKLSRDIVPVHYTLNLSPNAAFTEVAGSVQIDIKLSAPAEVVVLHALDIKTSSVKVDGSAASATVDAAGQTITIKPAKALGSGAHQVSIDYTAVIGDDFDGMFRVPYKGVDGKPHMVLATEMEPIGARRLLPLFDEPSFRATFDVTAVVPKDWVAISNGDVVSEVPLKAAAGEPARKTVKFARTPAMSSYLLALFMGEFERIEDKEGDTVLRLYAVKGKAEQGREALTATRWLMAYYREYFGVAYPLPKLDQIAIPGGFGGAMENWGAISYNEGTLLHNADTDTERHRSGVWSIVAHEVAHQWFGNLVTMRWWDDLWLNEGFASWMASKAVDKAHPEWQMWARASHQKSETMDEDALGVSLPIYRHIGDDREALNSFDNITYSKGEAFIRMLESWMGEEKFRDGIRSYMRKHAYANTVTADLWSELEASAGQPVQTLARGWVEQAGLPLIEVTRDCARKTTTELDASGKAKDLTKGSNKDTPNGAAITLRQRPFLNRADEAVKTQWSIPTRVALGTWLGTSESPLVGAQALTIPVPACDSPFKLNAGYTGYYRTAYDAASVRALLANAKRMNAEDRIELLQNSVALFRAGLAPAQQITDWLKAFSGELSPEYWTAVETVVDELSLVGRQLPGASGWPATSEQWRVILKARLAELQAGTPPRTNTREDLTRAILFRTLGKLDDASVTSDARTWFAGWQAQHDSLSPAMLDAVLVVVGRHANAADWNTLLGLLRDSSDERTRYPLRQAIAAPKDPALAERALNLMLNPEGLSRNDTQQLIARVARAGNPDLAWAFITKNWQTISARIGEWGSRQLAASVAGTSVKPARADELMAFTREHVGEFGMTSARIASAIIRTHSSVQFAAEKPPAKR
jgi:aminopeptidase N